jgi:regulation of enolase protein 1 (concanavalin A-like superfamily)
MLTGMSGVVAGASAAPVEVTGFLQTPIYSMQGGIGTNWHAMEQIHGGSAGKGNPKWDDTARWDAIRSYADWQGMDYMRVELEQLMYQPEDGVFTWESDEMRTLYVILDWCQAKGADVLLQEMWTGVEWNRIPGTPSAFRSAPNDMAKWAEGFAGMVDHLVNVKGYTCIRWVNIQNEGWWGSKHLEGYVAARAALDALDIDLPLVGPEGSSGMTVADVKPYLGGIEEHRYHISSGIADRGNGVPELPFFWGEFGTQISASGQSSYANNMICARWIVGGLNRGVDGFAKWEFTNVNNVDGEWSFIDTWDTATNTLRPVFSRRPNTFYMMGLLSRYSAKNSRVHSTYASHSAITTSLLKSPNGNWSLFVVNSDPASAHDLTIRLQGLDAPRMFHRYRVTPADQDQENVVMDPSAPFAVSPTGSTLADSIPANSVAVYSTYQLAATDPGVFDDGAYAALPSDALGSEVTVWNETNPNITYNGSWPSSSETGAHQGAVKFTGSAGAWFQFTFTGTGFRLYGKRDGGSGMGNVTINGNFVGYSDNYGPVIRHQQVIFDSGPLPNGTHTVRVTANGRQAMGSSGPWINLDAIGFPTDVGGTGSAPYITAHPQDQAIVEGANVTLSVAATGTAPLTFQWRKAGVALVNGGRISNATAANLTISGVLAVDAGVYDCVISNDAGNATSNPATLAVGAAPVLTITSPSVPAIGLPDLTDSLVLEAVAIDDGGPPAVTWSKVSGPGTVVFSNASSTSSAATFGAVGSYVLRCTASDGVLSTTRDLVVGAGIEMVALGGGDIGAVGAAGGHSVSGAVYSVSGEGPDIGGSATSDKGYFVGAPASGNFALTARVVTQTNTNPWAKAGVMVRESTSPGARYAGAFITPSTNGALQQYRASTNGTAAYAQAAGSYGAPHWVRVVRSGDAFSTYRSGDGATWTAIGSPQAIAMTDPVRIGFMVTSNSPGVLSTATFDNVSGLPATNQAPQVHPGTGPDPVAGQPFALGGAATDDGQPAPPALESAWSLAAGPAAALFDAPSAPSSNVTFSGAGTYTLRLAATDGVASVFQERVFTVGLAPGFAAWIDGFEVGVHDGPQNDPDGDGLCNFLEYAFGGLPDDAGSVPSPAASIVGDHLRLTFHRARGDVTYLVQAGTMLAEPGDWVELPFDLPAVGASFAVQDPQPIGAFPARFLRVKVLAP